MQQDQISAEEVTGNHFFNFERFNLYSLIKLNSAICTYICNNLFNVRVSIANEWDPCLDFYIVYLHVIYLDTRNLCLRTDMSA